MEDVAIAAREHRDLRLMVNRSVTWADWDEEVLSLELQELNAADFDLSLDRFRSGRNRRAPGDPDVGRLLGQRKPILLVIDPPYGIELDFEWRDRAGLNGSDLIIPRRHGG